MRHHAASVDQWWPHQIELSHVQGEELQWLGTQGVVREKKVAALRKISVP
jgi:hypothetical protein